MHMKTLSDKIQMNFMNVFKGYQIIACLDWFE